MNDMAVEIESLFTSALGLIAPWRALRYGFCFDMQASFLSAVAKYRSGASNTKWASIALASSAVPTDGKTTRCAPKELRQLQKPSRSS